jgi:hypothetical protein
MRRKSGRYKLRPTGPREKEIKDHDEGPRLSVVVKGKSGIYEISLIESILLYICMTLFHIWKAAGSMLNPQSQMTE